MKKMGIKYVLVMALSVFLLVVISPITQAAIGANIIPENVIQSGQNAWSAISDFMGEVWHDTTSIASSFFNKMWNDFKIVVAGTINTLGVIRGWIEPFIPASLKRALAAVEYFFLQLFQFINDVITNIFSALKPPTNIAP